MVSEAKGYGFKSRQPAGRSIVEGRGGSYKLTIWAQDLRPETLYRAFLLFGDERRYAGVDMGSLPVDERGKGEVRRDFHKDALGHFSLTDILGVVVVAKDAATVISPLCGYRDKPVAWRHGFYEFVAVAEVNTLAEAAIAVHSEASDNVRDAIQANIVETAHDIASHEAVVSDVPSLEDASNDATSHENMPYEATPDETIQYEANMHEDAQFIVMPDVGINTEPLEENPQAEATEPPEHYHIPMPHTTPNNNPNITDTEPEADTIPTDTPPPFIVTPPHQDQIHQPPPPSQQPPANTPTPPPNHLPPNWPTNLPRGEMAKAFSQALDKLHAETLQRSADCTPPPNFLALFDTKEAITPFVKQARKTKWVRFTLADQVPPPTNMPRLFEEPFIQAALEEHEHLILGMTTDQGPRRYILGVPGVFDQTAKQRAKRLGFAQFKCSRDAQPNWGESGYWLMFITVC